MELLIAATNAACWGLVTGLWIVLSIRDAAIRPLVRSRGSADVREAALGMVVIAALLVLGRPILAAFAVDAPLARLLGAMLLIAATAFAAWARVWLGRAWSIGPRAPSASGIRTDGPYGITRHPIYTGLLGMLSGSALLGGLGEWLVLPLVGLVVAELKIRSEERLLMRTFPDQYGAYRDRVPRLLPRLRGHIPRDRSAGARHLGGGQAIACATRRQGGRRRVDASRPYRTARVRRPGSG